MVQGCLCDRGSSSLKRVGEGQAREASCRKGVAVPGHRVLVVLHVDVCMRVSLCLGLGIRPSALENAPSLRHSALTQRRPPAQEEG